MNGEATKTLEKFLIQKAEAKHSSVKIEALLSRSVYFAVREAEADLKILDEVLVATAIGLCSDVNDEEQLYQMLTAFAEPQEQPA